MKSTMKTGIKEGIANKQEWPESSGWRTHFGGRCGDGYWETRERERERDVNDDYMANSCPLPPSPLTALRRRIIVHMHAGKGIESARHGTCTQKEGMTRDGDMAITSTFLPINIQIA